MLRRLVEASAIVIGLGLVAGCAITPVKMGSAAIVGSERISIAAVGRRRARARRASAAGRAG